ATRRARSPPGAGSRRGARGPGRAPRSSRPRTAPAREGRVAALSVCVPLPPQSPGHARAAVVVAEASRHLWLISDRGSAYHDGMTRRWPDLVVLELLTGVDDHESLSAAARAAGVAQPYASRMIKQLERQVGTPLLERKTTGATLTPHGRVLAHWARRVLVDATRLLAVAESLSTERAAELAVSASMTVAEHL